VIHDVIDASTAAEYLLRMPLGLKLADLIEGALLFAPELLDVPGLQVLGSGLALSHSCGIPSHYGSPTALRVSWLGVSCHLAWQWPCGYFLGR
jgi:hypothetical protein